MYDPITLLDNVDFTKDDMRTITPVKTSLFMRMNSMYYLLVPNAYTGRVSDMKLINISTPVNDILFATKDFVKLLSDRLYQFDVSWGETTVLVNYDFVNYVDSGKIRNIGRYVVKEETDDGLLRYHIDIVLVYDSDTGVWTIETASFPYTGLTTTGTTLLSSYARKKGDLVELYMQSLYYDNTDILDEYNTMFYGDAINDVAPSSREGELQALPSSGQDTVAYVVDGDTLDLETLGRVRLLYVNTPESTYTVEPYGNESKLFLRELLPEGSTVWYEFDENSARSDPYERALAWLRIEDSAGEIVQVAIAQKGYVKSYYDFGATKYVTEVETAVAYAMEKQLGLYKYVQPAGPFYVRTAQTISKLSNYQILDSGNRSIEPYIEKRFKEIQFMISNDSPNVLNFLTEFFVDSIKRKSPYGYHIEQDTDTNSDTYGTIYVVEDEEPNMQVANETSLSTWQLDISRFPDLEVVKVIFRINGRGHYPRFIFVSKNQDAYKILGYAWVARMMNAR